MMRSSAAKKMSKRIPTKGCGRCSFWIKQASGIHRDGSPLGKCALIELLDGIVLPFCMHFDWHFTTAEEGPSCARFERKK